MTRAAIYLRVSTEEQAEKFGLSAQREQCQAMATVKGWQVADVYQDAGISGTKGAGERPGLQSLLEACEAGEVEAVIVAALDRLGRSTLLIIDLVERIGAAGVEFVSCKESIDTSTPTGRFVLTVFAGLAQLERDRIVERTTAGRNARGKKDGERGGRVPLGYRRELVNKRATGQVEVVDGEAELVRRIFARRRGGATLRGIADELNHAGVTTRRGRQWHASSVREVLNNRPKYAGGHRGKSPVCWPAILE